MSFFNHAKLNYAKVENPWTIAQECLSQEDIERCACIYMHTRSDGVIDWDAAYEDYGDASKESFQKRVRHTYIKVYCRSTSKTFTKKISGEKADAATSAAEDDTDEPSKETTAGSDAGGNMKAADLDATVAYGVGDGDLKPAWKRNTDVGSKKEVNFEASAADNDKDDDFPPAKKPKTTATGRRSGWDVTPAMKLKEMNGEQLG